MSQSHNIVCSISCDEIIYVIGYQVLDKDLKDIIDND